MLVTELLHSLGGKAHDTIGNAHGQSVTVLILDGGIDIEQYVKLHPDGEAVKDRFETLTIELADEGWRTAHRATQFTSTHATRVAGIIGQTCPQAAIIDCQVVRAFRPPTYAPALVYSALVMALVRARERLQNQPKKGLSQVINISLCTSGVKNQYEAKQQLQDLVDSFQDLAVDFVVAAGNQFDESPNASRVCGPLARVNGVMVVGSCDSDGSKLARYSRRDTDPPLRPDWILPDRMHVERGSFGNGPGTSFACALASGIIASLRSAELAAQMNRVPSEDLKKRIRSKTGVDSGNLRPFSFGMLSV